MQGTLGARFVHVARGLADRQGDPAAEEGAESGFTLIELMVVLLIMAILMAIAIPTFLGVRTGAQDRSSQSDLTNAIISSKTIFTNSGQFPVTASLVSQLASSEPELAFSITGVQSNGAPHQISVLVSGDSQVLVISNKSADARCWYAEDNEEQASGQNGGIAYATTQQGVSYAGTPKGFAVPAATACGAGDAYVSTGPAGTATFSGWAASYPA